ncbi:MAG: hypothetical protein ACI4KH_03975 [Oscillospiraceae bacterium]
MLVNIYSREAIEKLINERKIPENTAIISFYDPKSPKRPKGYRAVDYKGLCDRLFYVGIHDIDPDILDEYGLTLDTYFPEATEVARFIIDAISDNMDIICQCDYGQSRSAGCAAAIREYYDKSGIEIFADYRYYPNQMIFNKMREALDKVHAEKFGHTYNRATSGL